MRKQVVNKIPFEHSPAFKVVYSDGSIGIEMPPAQEMQPQMGPQPQYEDLVDQPIEPGEADQLMQDYMHQMRTMDPNSVPREDELLPRK
jgi:hypothetical protein